MDAQQFLTEFGHIANAPNGIVKLRELVLQLAISGRLVEENESSQPVEDTIKEANDIREAYEEALKLRSTRMQPPLSKIPYIIPEHWKWERLERLCKYIQRGKGPKYVDKSSTYVVSQKCVQWSGFDLTPARHIADDSLEKYGKERFLCDGDLLWNSTGTGTAGRVAIYSTTEQKSAVADSHVTVIRLANCLPRYFWCVIASPWVQLRIEPSHSDSLVSGTTQQVELNTTTVRSLPIPLPPLEEQSRIVAKVDELMALCDQLEAQKQKLRTLQNHLRQATLQAVAASQSPHELQASWQRLQTNFGQLFSAPEDVDELDLCIKQLALKGLLTSRDTAEAISDELMQKSESTTAVESPEMDWEIPGHWIWARSAWLGEARLGKMLDASKNKGELTPYLRNVNVRWNKFDLHDVLQMRVEDHELPRITIQRGDLVICEGGEPGRSAIWDRDEKFVIQKALHRFRCGPDVLPDYLLFCLEHDYFSGRLSRFYTGATIKHLTGKALAEYSVPLPPVGEQCRILLAAKALSSVSSKLRKQLSNLKHNGELLATATISTLTGIAIEQEEEPMKAPQTELVATVRLGTPPDVKAQAPLATILARHNGEMSAKDLWQRFGGEIDAFYAQLKTEVAHGWLLEPAPAEMREKAES
ncbi:restriction endonuclease subunit S [Shewanella xiamenensis]|uniref:restriction endonuclease subunit S n=1 Tax=Shewanella xiamenensis TaxID=332186 RepID=UPI0004D37E84|nr:restriction endonuclease subunit S [Shewanella xiamenensis]KEK26927.1 type I restriction-modification system specificity [Shewanella xiamenensis]